MTNKKPRTGSERTSASVAKYRKAGLIQAKVWTHPNEADQLRSYAYKQPLTKLILSALKYEKS